MSNVEIKYLNNSSLSKIIFDEVIIWSSQKQPKDNIHQFLSKLEDIFDKLEERGYNLGYAKGYDQGRKE